MTQGLSNTNQEQLSLSGIASPARSKSRREGILDHLKSKSSVLSKSKQINKVTALEHHSKLIKLLNDLNESPHHYHAVRLGEKLGELIGLSDSFALADAHYKISTLNKLGVSSSSGELRDYFLRMRKLIVRSILKSFTDEAGVRNQAPSLAQTLSHDELREFDRYKRFYSIHQKEMAIQIQTMRTHIRKVLSAESIRLARLSALDQTMSDTIASFTLKQFAQIPNLLKLRFKVLCNTDQLSLVPHDEALTAESNKSPEWLDQFYAEVKALLLAELELRLEPLVGMVEAYEAEREYFKEHGAHAPLSKR